MGKKSSSKEASWLLYKRLLGYVRTHRKIFTIAVCAMAVTAIAEMAFAALFKPIMDSGFVDPDPDFVGWIPWLIMLVVVVRGAFGFLSDYSMAWVGRQIVFELRKQMFSQMVYLPAEYYDQNSSANLVSKLLYDVEQTASATTDALTLFIKDALTVIALVSWLAYLDWRLTLVFLVFGPTIIFSVSLASKRFRKLAKEYKTRCLVSPRS